MVFSNRTRAYKLIQQRINVQVVPALQFSGVEQFLSMGGSALASGARRFVARCLGHIFPGRLRAGRAAIMGSELMISNTSQSDVGRTAIGTRSTRLETGSADPSGVEADRDGVVEQLRSTMRELSDVAQQRAKRLKLAGQSAVRNHPGTTIGLATAGGVLIAAIIIVARSRRKFSRRFASMPADWSNVATAPSTFPSHAAMNRQKIVDYAERTAEAIARIDPQALSGEKLNALQEFAKRLWANLTKGPNAN
jgi:hypothetical protein